MILSPSETRQIITPVEDSSLISAPTEGMMRQASMVVKNRELDDEAYEQKMQTLSVQTARQLRESFNMDNQSRAIEEFNMSLNSDVGPEVLSLGLEALQKKQRINQAALEEEYAKAVAKEAEKDPVTKYIMDNDRSFFGNLLQDSKKNLAISNKLQEIKERSDWGDTGLNLLSEATMTSFFQRTFGFGLIDYASELRNLQTKLENADADEAIQILDEAEDIISATQILGDNPDYVYNELAEAFQGSQGSQELAGALNLFDFADTALIGSKFLKNGLKTGKNIIKISPENEAFVKLGNDDALAEAIAKGDREVVSDTAEQIGLGLGLKTEFDQAIGLSGKVRSHHEVNKRILAEVLDKARGVDYEDVQSIDMLTSVKDRLKREFNNGTVADITMRSDGSADVLMMKVDGSGYVSEATAKTAMAKRGFSGEVVQLPTGKWAIKSNLPSEDVKNANMSTAGVSWFTRKLRRPETWVDDDLLVYSQMSENSLNRILKEGQTVYDRSIGKLSKAQKKDFLPILERVMQYGKENQAWMTPKEVDLAYRDMYGRGVSEKEMNAYSGYRLLNEFQYELDNKVLYEKKLSQGYGSIDEGALGEGLKDVNAKVVDSFEEHDYIYVKETGKTLDKTTLDEGFLDKYDVLRVDDTSVLKYESDIPTPYIAVPKGAVEVKPLRYNQLAYLAGGRKRYDSDTVFLKQANTGTFPNGKKYRSQDGTFFTASSMPQGRKVQEEINAVNGILRKGLDEPRVREEAEALIQKTLPLGIDNVQDWLKRMADKGIRITEDIQAVRNREIVSQEGLPSEFMDDINFLETSNGRLGRRSEETLEHVDPDETSLLNPVASLNQNFVASAQNASLTAYRDYTLAYLERFRRYLDIDKGAPRIALLDANLKKGTKITAKQAQKIKGEQQFAQEVMGKRTQEELLAQSQLENNLEWALGRVPDKINWGLGKFDKNKFIGGAGGLSKEGVLGKIRGIVFNAKLGLFSLPAMVIQAIHAPIISIVAPRHGMKALTTYPILRMGLLSRDPDVIAEFGKKADKLGLTGYGDMNTFFREFRNLGFDSFGPNMAYENAAMGDNLVRSPVGKVLDKGRIFFEEGELVPRMVAYATSVREWRDNFGGINPSKSDITSKEASKYITQRVNTLTLGMTRADLQQGLKSGWMGLAAQFQSYPLRALDAMLFPSKGLTGAERSRLIAAYVIFYGGAGLPMLDGVVDKLVENTDIGENKTLTKTLYNGVIDGLVMAATGESTNFASRGGLGDWAKEIMRTLTGDGKAIDVLLGPAGSTGSGAFDTLIQYAKAHSAGYNPDPSQITSQALFDLVKQVSSFNNLYRTWVAYNTGKIYDARGNQFIEISGTKNLLQILGIPPQEYADVGAIFTKKDQRKQIIDLNVEMLLKLHTDFLKSKDYDEREAIRQQINTVSFYVQQDGLTKDVMSRVATKMSQGTTHERLINEALLLESTGQDALTTEMEVLND